VALQTDKSLEDRISGILLEYAQNTLQSQALSASQSLRNDLAIESLSLVSVVLRIGDEFGVDIASSGGELELSSFETVGDMWRLGQSFLQTSTC
jgi:acyl carrier protein